MSKREADFATVKWIFKKSKSQLGSIIFLIFGNLIFSSVGVLTALICKGVIDAAVSKDMQTVYFHAVALVAVVVVQFVLRLVCNSISQYSNAKLTQIYQQDLLRCVLDKEYSEVSKMHSGEILNRMFSDVQIVSDGVISIVPSFVGMITKLACAMVAMIYLEKTFAFAFAFAGVVIFLILRLFRNRLKGLHKQVQEKQDKVRSFFQETIKSTLIVKVFRANEFMQNKAKNRQDDYFAAQMKRRTILIFANAGMGFVFQIGYAVALIWGAYGILIGSLTYGTLTAMLQLVNQIQSPISGLSGVLPHVYSVIASAERMIDLEKLTDESQSETDKNLTTFDSVVFENVDFSYGRNTILDNVSFRIKKGDFVSFTGLSGGGKSTMFLLMLGVYHPNGGAVSIESDGEVYAAGKDTRSLFAYVPQENCLLSGTVRENIAFMTPSATDEQVVNAARIACADAFIDTFPDGYDTVIGEDGFGLSEGQAQRIAIARAILSDAPILLLDESTSALDEETESKLLQNLSKLDKKTCMIVTHRRAALAICNKHLTIENGLVSIK